MFGKPIITNIEGLRLDRFFKSDMEYFAQSISDPDINKWIYIDNALSKEQEEEWYDDITARSDRYIWGIYYDNKLIGNCGLINIHPIKRNSEIGITVFEKSIYGKGIGTECVRVLTDYAFNELNCECVYYEASVENKGSIACAKKNGFLQCGEIPHAFYHDGQYYSMWFGYKLKQ